MGLHSLMNWNGICHYNPQISGSEYPAVIMPLLSGPRMLFNRNILYTAVTRAKKCVAIVGDEHTVRHMIENEKQQRQYTSLNLRLRE